MVKSISIEIKKKTKTYVTTMYRYGDRESHSYVIYAGRRKSKAIHEGEKEKNYRGKKYELEVVEFPYPEGVGRKIVKSNLDDQLKG